MAKTFDLDDPGQKSAYLEETIFQILMFGALYQTVDCTRNTVTVLHAPDIEISIRDSVT
jgi:hypothetical protein